MKIARQSVHRAVHVVTLLSLVPVACALENTHDREANAFEWGYSHLVADLRMPELCEKISPRAYVSAGWAPRGYRTSYVRSECYYALALTTRNTDYCEHVVPRNTAFADGSAMSRQRCEDDVAAGDEWDIVGGEPDLISRFLGYTDESIDRWSGRIGMASFYRVDAFFDLSTKPEFKERAKDLPDFARSGPAITVEFAGPLLGCRDDEDDRWFCTMAMCLRQAEHDFRDACLVVAEDIRRLQEIDGFHAYDTTPDVAEAIERHPSLATIYRSAKASAPRVRREARAALEAAKAAKARDVEEQTRHKRVPFSEIDLDRNGFLSFEEFIATPNRHFKPDSGARRWEETFRPADVDQDGLVTLDEYVALEPRKRDTFAWADVDHDGVVERAELLQRYDEQNAENARGAFDRPDVNDDARLDPREYSDDIFVNSELMRKHKSGS